ncbi:hypothetical protein BKA63DRAFT_494765 [Paraphoma chrysanthemicola]|nr:hypothetical protein BKA63DRAFT_494765 [Paraphoma chrysanthemicola]
MKGKEIRMQLKTASKKTGNCLKRAAWQTCKCALWITCAPCLCCALLCLPRRRRRGCVIHGERIEYVRPQFPTPRPRALSLPLVAPQVEQGTLEQPQSDFMTKLPLELRRMVYERTLGGASIHLATHNGKPSAMQCWRDECLCEYFDPLLEKKLSFGTGLLRTCRVIYSEAIEYLYSANQFCLSTDPDEIATLKHLSWYFLPQRMIQIRDMRVHWPLDSYHFFLSPEHGPLSLDTWAPSWEALSRLTGLRRLHINVAGRHVDGTPQELWQEQGANFIKMARTITAPREFVIILPDRECETDYDVGDSRCVLRLPEDTRPTTDDSLL